MAQFNVDPGIKAPQFQGPSGGGGSSGNPYSGFGDTIKGIAGLFDGIAANKQAATMAQIGLDAARAKDETDLATIRDVDPVIRTDSDTNIPPAQGGQGGAKVDPSAPPDVTNFGGTSERMAEAYRQGKLTKTAYYNELAARQRQLMVKYPGYADQISAITQKAWGVNASKEAIDSYFKEQDEQQKLLKEADAKWDAAKNEAASLGIPADVLRKGDADPNARKQIQAEIYNRKAQNATLEKRKQALDLDKAETANNQDKAYNLALDHVNTFQNNLFSDSFAATAGFSFKDIVAKSRSALADNVVTPEERNEIVKMFGQFKQAADLQYAGIMNNPFGDDKRSYNARIGDKSKLDNIKASYDQRMSLLEDSLTNKHFGILSWNKAMIESISETDQINLFSQNDTFRILKQLKETGGDAAVNTWLTANMGKLKEATDGVKLGTIATKVVAGQPLGTTIQENKGSTPQASGVLADTSIKQATSIVLDPKSSPQTIMSVAESLFGQGNRDFMQQFNTASKSKVFDIVASPAMTERMVKLGKDNPQALKTYSDWAVASFGNIFKDAADTLKNHVTSAGPIGLGTPGQYNAQNPITFDGKFFQITEASDGNVVSVPSSLSAQYSKQAIDRINGALKNLYPILEASGQDPMSALNTLFANSNIQGEAKDMLMAASQAFMASTGSPAGDDEISKGKTASLGEQASGIAMAPMDFFNFLKSGGTGPNGPQPSAMEAIKNAMKDIQSPADFIKWLSNGGSNPEADLPAVGASPASQEEGPSGMRSESTEAARVAAEAPQSTSASQNPSDMATEGSPTPVPKTEGKPSTASPEASRAIVKSTGRVSPTGVTYNADGTANAAPRDAAKESMRAYLDEFPSSAGRAAIEAQLNKELKVNEGGDNYNIRYRPNKKAQATFKSVSPKDYGEGTIGLLNFIGDKEAGGDYNNYYGRGKDGGKVDFSKMTIAEVLQWQRAHVNNGSPSSAAGKYQFIQKTLRGLKQQLQIPDDTPFTPELQDRLAYRLLEQRGLSRFLSGQIDEDTFVNNLAQEWAAIPKTNSVSAHAGDGLNAARTSVASIRKIVQKLKEQQKKT